MKDFLFFDSMVTPKIITVIYWLLLLSVIGTGLGTMFFGYQTEIFSGLGIIIGGVIAARVWCEMLIVLFKINDNLQRIADKK